MLTLLLDRAPAAQRNVTVSPQFIIFMQNIIVPILTTYEVLVAQLSADLARRIIFKPPVFSGRVVSAIKASLNFIVAAYFVLTKWTAVL